MIFFWKATNVRRTISALTSRSLDELASMRDRADELILDIWNQVEANIRMSLPMIPD